MMVPDPLAFTIDGVARHGGLVDVGPGAEAAEPVLAILPSELAADLGLPEEVRLCRTPEEGKGDGCAGAEGAGPPAVPCGLGAPLLQRLVADARAVTPTARARVAMDPPRPAHAAALGERCVVRNGLCELLDAFPGESVYVAASVAYVAEADDRHEGMVQVVVHAADGAVPDEHLGALLDPALRPSLRAVAAGRTGAGAMGGAGALVAAPSLPGGAEAAAPWVALRAPALVEAAIGPVREAVARRHARDHARIAEYFGALIDEARKPRRRLDPQAVAAKVVHLVAERDSKLLDLQSRFALRVSVQPAALVCAVVPVVRLRLRVRRRKGERELITRLPAGAHALDQWACDGCAGSTARPALCDDRLHVLCERCVPQATGRPRCPACRR